MSCKSAVMDAPRSSIRETENFWTSLTDALLSVRALLEALPPPVKVAPGSALEVSANREGWEALESWFHRLESLLELPPLQLRLDLRTDELSLFERVISQQLALDRLVPPLKGGEPRAWEEVAREIRQRQRDTFEHRWRGPAVATPDGVTLRSYRCGEVERDTVILVAPCGMPARLCEGWMTALGERFQVATWETRGLFDSPMMDGWIASDISAQVGDLFSVLDALEVESAHLVGLCGGAVIALQGAAQQPDRVKTLSLWHGDFNLLPEIPWTAHQRDLASLMALGAQDRQSGSMVHRILCRAVEERPPQDLGHLVLYPYANAELLHRYCKLNGSIMERPVAPLLARVPHRTLVVTSQDDSTAHPAGSRAVAERLSRSLLHVRRSGDHISLFHAAPSLLELADQFLSGLMS